MHRLGLVFFQAAVKEALNAKATLESAPAPSNARKQRGLKRNKTEEDLSVSCYAFGFPSSCVFSCARQLCYGYAVRFRHFGKVSPVQ